MEIFTGSFRGRIRPFVNDELRSASICEMAGDLKAGFRHLERAHILGQASTIEHVRTHFHMLAWGLRHRDLREVAGQVLRVVGAATKTVVPHGNTGGSDVSPFRSMPIPGDLAAIIAFASAAPRSPSASPAPSSASRSPEAASSCTGVR
ncbi:MAG: DUF3703 domain-containing protein [Rhodospirillaceae bacterium]|nr:DUF3703 domain-containing protein [Rhodospirillaceae bacterium]